MSSPRRLFTTVALAVALLGVSAAAPVGSAAGASQSPGAVAAKPSPKLDWKGCGNRGECAKLTVPLDYDHAENGKTIKVALFRVRAGDSKQRIGSLLMNPGGPGASGVEFVQHFASSLPKELQARFDIVGFDPRGTGGTEPVKCRDNLDDVFSLDYTPDTPEER